MKRTAPTLESVSYSDETQTGGGTPAKVGVIEQRHSVVMAPMSRLRAKWRTTIPTDADYFDRNRQRPTTIRAIPEKHNEFERPVSRDRRGGVDLAKSVRVAEGDDWTNLMRSALQGDNVAYHRLLKSITPILRTTARRALARVGQPVDQSEDIVQDILIAIHLKRHTWNTQNRFAPWLFAIARNKLIDSMRRRRGRVFVDIDHVSDSIPTDPAPDILPVSKIDGHLDALPLRPREVLRSIAIAGESISVTAKKLSMSEGAVRVALHRALSKLAEKVRT